MDQGTVDDLLELNRQFYQGFGPQFSATRQRIQPGVKRIIAQLTGTEKILDLGCGNGELYRALDQSNYRGLYVGLDFSGELLNIASNNEKHSTMNPAEYSAETQADLVFQNKSQTSPLFIKADLSTQDWDAAFIHQKFDIVLAFAVLHHLPSKQLRHQVLFKVHKLLLPGGRFIHSEWQFLNSPRLRDRIQPWDKIGLDESRMEQGDYLLDWRQGGYGMRYVHHFTLDELSALAEDCEFIIMETFYSDGEGSKLGLYQTWKKQ